MSWRAQRKKLSCLNSVESAHVKAHWRGENEFELNRQMTKSMQGVAATAIRLRLTTKKYIMAFCLRVHIRSDLFHFRLHTTLNLIDVRHIENVDFEVWGNRDKEQNVEFEILSVVLFFVCVARTRHWEHTKNFFLY